MNEEDEEYEEDEKRTCYRTRRIASHPMPSAHAHVCIYVAVGTHTCNDHGDEDNGDTALVDDDDGMVLVMVMTTTTTRATTTTTATRGGTGRGGGRGGSFNRAMLPSSTLCGATATSILYRRRPLVARVHSA